MISEKLIKDCSYKFTNGVIVVNTTPHSLSFLSPEGEKIVVPTSVPSDFIRSRSSATALNVPSFV